MDRQAWIAVTLCVIGLVVWQIYMTTHPMRPVPRVANGVSPSPAAASSAATSTPADNPPATAAEPTAVPTPAAAASPAAPSFAEKTEVLANGDVELRLTNRGGGISEVVLPKHVAENGAPVVLNSRERAPIGAILDKPEAPTLPEFTMARQPDGSFQLERVNPGGVTIRKKFSLPPPEKKDNFLARMDLDFRNDGPEAYSNPGYYLALGMAMPIHAGDLPSYTRLVWCIDGKGKSIDATWFAAQNYPLVGVQKRAAQEFYTEKTPNAEWAGMSSQFFATLLTPLNSHATDVWARRFEVKHGAETVTQYGIEGAMMMPAFELQPGQTASVQFQVYTGPKLYNRLAELQHDETAVMNFGIFKLVSQFLLNLMNSIHRFVGNYAVAILILTAIIKMVLWPLQNKANRSMRRMSLLSPKMQELKEKYKDDPTRMNQEVMKLYKDYGVNPVSGCLPMAIQIPIFFGLFNMLREAVELRNAKFLWVHDLSQPDTVAHVPGLGWPVNILPLIMAATNIWLMQMTPKTGDATQRRVMMFMPLIFVIFCYNFAAALALYYTTQNLFTILQLWYNQKQPMPTLERVTPAGKKGRKARR
jgi:YidC/Oxa1 family membrane protein insertase